MQRNQLAPSAPPPAPPGSSPGSPLHVDDGAALGKFASESDPPALAPRMEVADESRPAAGGAVVLAAIILLTAAGGVLPTTGRMPRTGAVASTGMGAPPPTPAPDAAATPREAIGDVLARVRRAMNGLDVRAAGAVTRPEVADQLSRSFAGLWTQDVRFDGCEVTLRQGGATAECHGSVRDRPLIEPPADRERIASWTIELVQDGGGWVIESLSER